MFSNLKYEKALYNRGIRLVAGVDEVGRGPLAGPVVAAAVILDLDQVFSATRINDVSSQNSGYSQINDSKRLSPNKRSKLSGFIEQVAISISIIQISHKIIDHVGIVPAVQQAFSKSIKNLKIQPEHILIDAFKIKSLNDKKQTNIIKGDNLSISIAAASIIAKVFRDKLMIRANKMYPMYGFDTNKGYGTRFHLAALKQHGVCKIHRKSYEPIKSGLVISYNVK